MKHIILIVLLMLSLTACGAQNTNQIVTDVEIQLAVEPNPPAVGAATLLITVLASNGTPIDSATVVVHGNMDHEGMAPVDGETSASVDGVYRVPFEWTMGGGWLLDVTVTLPDKRGIASAQFEQFVGAVSQDSIVNRGPHNNAGIDIRYMSDNDPAIAGDANVTVFVTDTDGHPINDATVLLFATMPEHEMLPISQEVNVGENGRYVIPLRWTMAGEWSVEITVTLTDGHAKTENYEQIVAIPD